MVQGKVGGANAQVSERGRKMVNRAIKAMHEVKASEKGEMVKCNSSCTGG